jgi:TolA-binding protein
MKAEGSTQAAASMKAEGSTQAAASMKADAAPASSSSSLRSPKRELASAPRPSAEARVSRAEENRLFQVALQERRRGNGKRARELFEQFLRTYPESPLLGQARAELRAIEPKR